MKFKNASKIERLRLLDEELKLQRVIIKDHITDTRNEIDGLKHKPEQTKEDIAKLQNLQGQLEAMQIHEAVLRSLQAVAPESY